MVEGLGITFGCVESEYECLIETWFDLLGGCNQCDRLLFWYTCTKTMNVPQNTSIINSVSLI